MDCPDHAMGALIQVKPRPAKHAPDLRAVAYERDRLFGKL
jgi:hypothetical protein